MNIRFLRSLTALGLAAMIAAAGIGAVTPDLQFNSAPTDTALMVEGVPGSPEVQGAEVPAATPDLQFC